MRFPNNLTVAASKEDYAPVRSAVKPPGFAEIEAVRHLAADSAGWAIFMRDVAQMPLTMTAAVQEAVRRTQWRISPNPMATIRKVAYQEVRRVGIQ